MKIKKSAVKKSDMTKSMLIENTKTTCLAMCIAIMMTMMSCEDPIDVPLQDGGVQVVVDAWIDNQVKDQEIVLSLSQPYFDSTQPEIIRDAQVVVNRDDGASFDFSHIGDGRYVWSSNGESLGNEGDVFTLNVDYDNLNYTSTSIIHRVPVIDSVGVEFRVDEIFLDDGYYTQFYARDPMGKGDTYWIKTFHNGAYLDKSQELNIAYDAGFDAGSGVDGLIFIPPLRELTNRLDEDLLSVPYELGDTVSVELHSINNQAFNFLEIARDQINNGDNGIFSIPLANPRGNITASDGSLVLGFFNVAGVSKNSRVIGE